MEGRGTEKMFVLTRGNGSQHAIVIIGDGKGLDLEDLAAANVSLFPTRQTRFAVIVFAALWILLLITALGIRKNTWFLLAIGGVGILQNIYVAGTSRSPQAFGVPLEFVEVIGEPKVMHALFKVEKRYPRVGRSMLATFFRENCAKMSKQNGPSTRQPRSRRQRLLNLVLESDVY